MGVSVLDFATLQINYKTKTLFFSFSPPQRLIENIPPTENILKTKQNKGKLEIGWLSR